MSKKEFKAKIKGSTEEIMRYLDSLVASLKQGTLVLQKNDEHITFKPREAMTMEIEAEQKKEKEEIKIELSWKAEEVVSAESPVELVISSKEPEQPAEKAGE